MEVEQEDNTTGTNIEPTPLALEGSSAQLELEVKPKPAPKATKVVYEKKDFIKKIIGTQKESGSIDPSENTGTTTGTASANTGTPKEDQQAIISRLSAADKNDDDNTPPPTEEETQDYAEMIVDGVDAIFVFLAQLWSKDSDDKEYQATPDSKKKLKKYLAKILARAGKKYPIGWMFIGLMVVCYFPLAKKAHAHRKLVDEERAKSDPNVIVLDGNPKRRRRRKDSSNDEPQFYNAEEVR